MSVPATVLYVIAGSAMLLVGALYLRSRELLPAHMAVFGRRWTEVSERERYALTMLEQGLGFAIGGVGLTIVVLAASPLADAGRWAALVATAAGWAIAGPATAYGLVAQRRYGVRPPWQASALVAVLLTVALVIELL